MAFIDRRGLIVALARECLGTVFRHQGRIPGVGMDCVGVVIHCWHGLGLPRYERADYGRNPHPARMCAELDRMLEPLSIPEADVGDVLHMAWGRQPQHLAVISTDGLIHAYEGAGRVVEHAFDATWRGRVRAAYRFPGVA